MKSRFDREIEERFGVSLQDMSHAAEMSVKLAELWSTVKTAPAEHQAHRRKAMFDAAARMDWSG